MKTRNDFVSNSSSCSFVIVNPEELKLDSGLVNILMSANYLHFIDIAYWKTRKVNGGRTVKAYDKFKDTVSAMFGTKAHVSFEHRDCDEVPPEEAYVELETDNFFKNYTAKKRDMLEKLLACSSMVHLNFGENIEGGESRAMQAATLLDYIYGAEISSDDSEHFEYSPVADLGIMPCKPVEEKMHKERKIDPNNLDAVIDIDSATVCARIVSNDEFLHSTDKDIVELKDRMFGKKRKDSIYYGDVIQLPLRVLLKLYKNVPDVIEASKRGLS